MQQYWTYALNNKMVRLANWSKGYKTLFMLVSTEHEISIAHKTKIWKNEEISCSKSLKCCIYRANKC